MQSCIAINRFGIHVCFSPNPSFKPIAQLSQGWPQWKFDEIIIVSDGTCGSACSTFVSKLMTSNNVRVVTIGGRKGGVIDSSSFAGGGVIKSDDCMLVHMPTVYLGKWCYKQTWLGFLPRTSWPLPYTHFPFTKLLGRWNSPIEGSS